MHDAHHACVFVAPSRVVARLGCRILVLRVNLRGLVLRVIQPGLTHPNLAGLSIAPKIMPRSCVVRMLDCAPIFGVRSRSKLCLIFCRLRTKLCPILVVRALDCAQFILLAIAILIVGLH